MSIVTETGIADQVKEELKKQGGYFLTKEQSDKPFLLRANGTMNPKIVGRTALKIAEMAESRFRMEQSFSYPSRIR
ncbi:hypothetical protein [Hungatella sp.]|uniref:hypothetical protein n=1 Tax=Hungatella sp. TaxID=2613924 RepID=UPI003993EEC1